MPGTASPALRAKARRVITHEMRNRDMMAALAERRWLRINRHEFMLKRTPWWDFDRQIRLRRTLRTLKREATQWSADS